MRTRIRTIKPEFFVNFKLDKLGKDTGLPVHRVFSGCWCIADREGRFEWRPEEMHLAILPYDDYSMFYDTLTALVKSGYIVKYESVTDTLRTRNELVTNPFGYIPSWDKHQRVRADEAKSECPDPHAEGSVIIEHDSIPLRTRNELVTNPSRGTGTGSGNGTGRYDMSSCDEKSKRDEIAKTVIAYLNKKSGYNYDPEAKGHRKFIFARVKEGKTEQDFINVIDQQCALWCGDPKWHHYLRPSTLFNGEKMEQYLGQVGAKKVAARATRELRAYDQEEIEERRFQEALKQQEGIK